MKGKMENLHKFPRTGLPGPLSELFEMRATTALATSARAGPMTLRRQALTLLALLLALSVANAQISTVDPNTGGGGTGGGGTGTGGGDASGGGAGAPAGDGATAGDATPPPPPPPPPPEVTMYGSVPLVEGRDHVGPVSEQTGYRYKDLQDVIDAAEADPRVETRDALVEKYGEFGEDAASNETGADGEEKEKPSPLSFLYGVDESSAEFNKRLICRRGCVDPLLDVNLVWCAGVVNYQFCNRTITGPSEVSVLNMESGAIAAYMSLSRKVPDTGSACKMMLRSWMCYEFFNRCNADGTQFYPVCYTTCQAARFACGNPDWIDCDQEVEELEGGYPDEWRGPDGSYIRGLKLDGQMGHPVFEQDALRCTGGSGRRYGAAPAFAAFVSSLVSVVLIVSREAKS